MSSKKKAPRRRPRSASPATNKKRAATTSTSDKSRSANRRSLSRRTRKSATADESGILDRVARYGVLRSLMTAAAVLLILFATSAGVIPVYSGWPFVPTVLLPVLVPLIFMLLLLDALMGRVLMSDMRGAERMHRRNTVIVNLLLALILLLRWLPYYLALGK